MLEIRATRQLLVPPRGRVEGRWEVLVPNVRGEDGLNH